MIDPQSVTLRLDPARFVCEPHKLIPEPPSEESCMLKRLIATTAVAALALTACSGGTGAGTAGGSGGGGEPVKKIKLVAAEYSKDHTAAFWNQFADDVQGQDGQHPRRPGRQLGRHRPAVQHDDPEQPRPGHPQPQRVRQLRQGRPALHVRRGPAPTRSRATSSTPSSRAAPTRARCTACRTCPRRARCSTTRTLFSQGRHRRRRRRPGTSSRRTPRRSPRSATAASATRCRSARRRRRREFSIWTVQQRRRLEDRRQVDDQLAARTSRR